MNEDKIYVDVNATFTKDGMLLPKSFVWEDGVEYEISKVKDIRCAARLKGRRCRDAIYMCRRRKRSISVL